MDGNRSSGREWVRVCGVCEMIKPRQEWQIYAELYEKEIKRLNDYIIMLLEEKRMAQTAYFVMGFATGFILSAMFAMWVMK